MGKANSYMENKKLFKKDGSEQYREVLVKYALKHGNKPAAREFKTNIKTVRKWVRSYLANLKTVPENVQVEVTKLAERGVKVTKVLLADLARAEELKGLSYKTRLNQPHPNKMPDDIKQAIIDYRDRNEGFGARIIKENLDLPYSEKTIHKKLVQNGMIPTTYTKYRKKRDMAWMRALIETFEKLQIDVKYLTDIPNLLYGIKFLNLPKYQITVRDYNSGFTFIGFSYFKDSTSVGIFVAYVINCLISAEVDLSTVTFQPDNGAEFRHPSQKKGYSLFETILNLYKIKYKFIPICRPTFNSDVESFHNIIEKWLYKNEKFESLDDFLTKTYLFMVWYNTYHKNRNKENKSPADILKDINFNKINTIITFPPILVDNYVKDIELVKTGGYLKWLPPKKIYRSSLTRIVC